MSIASLKERLPDYAKDIRLNLSSVSRTETLTPTQLWGTLLATALASRNPDVIAAIDREASEHLSAEARDAARGAASIMAMNNIYYRFLHLSEDPEYARMPARLRMHIIGKPGVDKLDFELWCLAVSAINGCGNCIASHSHELTKAGASRTMIQDAVRIASIVHATAAVLDGESAMASPAAAAA